MVSAACRLQKAAAKKGVEFKMSSPDGNPVEQRYVDTLTGGIYAPAECGKAVIAPDGSYVAVAKETVKAIDESCKIDSLTIEGFMDLTDVPMERSEACYFIAPPKGATPVQIKPLALLAAGLRETGKAGHGKLTLRTTQRSFVIYEKDGGLVLNTLCFADEFIPAVEAAEPYIGFDVDEKMIGLASTLIEAQASDPAALDAYSDDSKIKKAELVEAVLSGETIVAPTPTAAPVVQDDMEALLLASIGKAPKAAKPKKAAKVAA
jgi:Ku protein